MHCSKLFQKVLCKQDGEVLVRTQKTTRVKRLLLDFIVRLIQHVYVVNKYGIVSLAKKALSVQALFILWKHFVPRHNMLVAAVRTSIGCACMPGQAE